MTRLLELAAAALFVLMVGSVVVGEVEGDSRATLDDAIGTR